MKSLTKMRQAPKKVHYLALKTYIFLGSLTEKFRKDMIESLNKLKHGLQGESQETKEMLETYYLYSQGAATKEEMEKANAQFRDLLKAMGLGFFVVLPFAPVTIPLIVKLGKRFGIEVLPSSFQEEPKKIENAD